MELISTRESSDNLLSSPDLKGQLKKNVKKEDAESILFKPKSTSAWSSDSSETKIKT